MQRPEDRGTYVLIVSVAQMKRIEIGRLFYAKRRPSFRWFEEQIRLGFEAEVWPQRVVLDGG